MGGGGGGVYLPSFFNKNCTAVTITYPDDPDKKSVVKK